MVVLSAREIEFLNEVTPYLPEEPDEENKLLRIALEREENGTLNVVIEMEKGTDYYQVSLSNFAPIIG